MRELICRDDELSVGVAAHSVDGARRAGSNGIGVATRMLRCDGDGAIRTTNNGVLVIERIGFAEVNNEAGVFGSAHEGDGGSGFNTKGFVGFGTGDARGRGRRGALAASNVDGAR